MMLQKIKAGALQFTMFIVVVIALLLASFIILIDTHKRFNIKTDFVLETIENTNKGINYVLQNDIKLNDTFHVNLQDEDYKILKVHRDYWGVFEKVMASSKIKTNVFKKTALIGASQSRLDRTSLYIEDNNKPLVVVGNTKIQGVAYVPKQGVRTGNISGHSYYGSQLIYGATRTSKELPEILKETLEQLKTVQDKIEDIHSNQFLDLGKTRTCQNSFLNPLQIVYSMVDINLSQISLTGHILIQSKTKITVDASSNLKDVILIAPIIEVKNDVKGFFQCIATKKINVGENCSLDYPSALVLNEEPSILYQESNHINQEEDKDYAIKIAKKSIIKGTVIFLGETKNYKAQIFIDENVTIEGEVYCNKNLELLGDVYGSVYTSNFVASQSGSVYQNHIYNGNILIDNLPQEYIGLSFKDSKKGVLKWLY